MLAFRDFAPRNLSPPSWGRGKGEWERLEDALADANEWVRSERVDVINVETVVIPCHVDTREFAKTDAPASFINGSHWYVHRQFIRVWYRAAGSTEPSEAEA
jgi:hypothetical protein